MRLVNLLELAVAQESSAFLAVVVDIARNFSRLRRTLCLLNQGLAKAPKEALKTLVQSTIGLNLLCSSENDGLWLAVVLLVDLYIKRREGFTSQATFLFLFFNRFQLF